MIDRLRDELQSLTDSTLALARDCRFARLRKRNSRLATTLVPTVAQGATASVIHRRLSRWHDAVSSVLRRRGIPGADLDRTFGELSRLVLLERLDDGMVTVTRWRAAFEEAVLRAATDLDRVLVQNAPAFVFPRRPPKPYDRLHVRVESGADAKWRVHVSDGSLDSEEAIVAPFGNDELEEFLARHCQPEAGLPEMATAEQLESMRSFGGQLFRAIFHGSIRAHYESARRDAALRGRTLRLEFAAASDACQSVPWEVLHDGTCFLAVTDDVLVAHSVSQFAEIERSLLPSPLRILLTVSTPHGVDNIDVVEAQRTIEKAIAPLAALGLVELEVSPGGSIDGLSRRLRSAEDEGRPHHVWHFIGHGELDWETGHDELVMSHDEDSHRVMSRDVGEVLTGHPQLRLVVLNACREGMNPKRTWQAAEALLDLGVRTVVAMQFELSYQASAVFDAELYGAITDGASVDEAVVAARRALIDIPNYSEWLTPVIVHGSGRSA